MNDIIYLNGEILPADEARVSVLDAGFLHGAGLFETFRADYGRVFRLDDHLSRMLHSAEKLGLPVERPDLPLTSEFEAVLKAAELDTARMRLTVTMGRPQETAESISTKLTVCLTATPLPPYPPELAENGMSVMISAFTQSTNDPLAGHKTLNYFPRLLALRNAQRLRCGEALWFTPQNLLAEGCISNVFVVRDRALATPPLNTPVLPGVSRTVILELAQKLGIPAEEKPLTINDLLDANEVFLSNSSLQVAPVCRVEKKDIGGGKPGPIAARLRQAFIDLVKEELTAGA